MCIYTARKYNCWCGDYYVKASNACARSLSTGQPCPKPTSTSGLEKEYCGICDYHLLTEEARLQAQGVPNPGYSQTEDVPLRRANTARYSNTASNASSLPSTSEGAVEEAVEEAERERKGRAIREAKAFPLSPPPSAPTRRSEPTLPNPFYIPKLLRSKTSASQHSKPSRKSTRVEASPLPLQRSKTTAQAAKPARPKELQRSKTAFTLLSPPKKQKPKPTKQDYEPITALHLTSPPPLLSPLRGTNPVRTALRDSNGFFIDPAKFSIPLSPSPSSSPRPPQLEKRYSNTSSSSRIPLSPPRPLSERAPLSLSQSPGPLRNSDPPPRRVRPDSDPFADPPTIQRSRTRPDSDPFADPESTGGKKEREERRLSELERRRSNRSSFVYQKFDDGPGVLMDRVERDREVEGGRFRESGVRRWVAGILEGDEEEGDRRDDGGGGMREERRKSRKSVRRSRVKSAEMRAGAEESEEEVLYSGSEYQTEYSYGKREHAKQAESEKTQAQSPPDAAEYSKLQPMDMGKNATGKAVAAEEEEVIYSDGSYETDYRYSDED